MIRTPLVLSATLLAVAATAPAALAHKMELVAKFPAERPEVVRVEVGYEGDEPVEGATVVLTDPSGTRLAEGTTNDTGVCELQRPPAGEYLLTADDGTGHQAKLTLTVPASPDPEEFQVGHRASLLERAMSTVIGLGLIAGATVLFVVMKRRAHRQPRAV